MINITLNSYGQEDLSHITDKMKMNLIQLPYTSVQKMIEQVHFSNKKPENKNIAITNKKENMIKVYKKAIILNKLINKDTGQAIISCYKRASNILENELKGPEFQLSNSVDPGLFKNDFEKNLFKKIHELRKYFTNTGKDENFELSLKNLAESKVTVFDFFENVMVNDEDKDIKKNRLELLQMLCRTYDNFLNFSNIERL